MVRLGILFIAVICCVAGSADAQRFIIQSAYNGQLTQTSGSFLGGYQSSGEFALVDNVKMSRGNWGYVSPGGPVNISCQNAYGFPTYGCDGVPINNGGWSMGAFYLPTQTERAGNYIGDWVGGAGTTIDFTHIGGSISSFSGAGCTQSGNKITGANCAVTIATPVGGANAARWLVVIAVDATTPLSQLRFYHVNDTAAVNLCYTGLATNSIPLMQNCFTQQFLTAASNFGVFRHLYKSNALSTNEAVWSDRTPPTWVTYGGDNLGANYVPSSIVTTNNPVSVSTAQYTLSAPNFCPGGILGNCDKQHIIVLPSSAIATLTTTANGAVTSGSCPTSTFPTPTTCTINLNSVPAGIVAGMTIGDANNGNAIQPSGVTVQSVGASSVTLVCVYICINPSDGGIANGDTIAFSPMLNVNGLGYVPLADLAGNNFGNAGSSTAKLYANWSTLTYDAQLNLFLTYSGGTLSLGLAGGWPPELMVALSNKLGAHPWYVAPCYAMDTFTNYTSQLATLNRYYLQYGLIPRDEGPNENWNNNDTCTHYAYAKQYLKSGVDFDVNNWYGQLMSNIGQAWSAAYGLTQTTPAATRALSYWVVDSMWTTVGIPTKGGGGQDTRLTSAWAVSNIAGFTPAYDWITHVSITGYWGSTCYGTLNELGIAYAYSISPATSLVSTYLNDTSPSVSPACGVNVTTASNSLYYLVNTIYPSWANYVSSYVNAGYSIALTQYEAGGAINGGNSSFNNAARSAAIPAFTPGSPTVLILGANAYNYICNTASLCTGSAPTGAISGTGCAALDAKDPAIQSATSTTITVNLDSTGCTTSGTGSIVYDGAGGNAGYVVAFEHAVITDPTATNMKACEIANLNSFYAAAAAASPAPIITAFPAEFDLSDGTAWAKYFPNVYATGIPMIAAVQAYQANPGGGSTTCAP